MNVRIPTSALSIIAMLVLSTSASFGQDTTPIAEPTRADLYRGTAFAVGLNAGFISGTGLSARIASGSGFAAQFTTVVITLGDITHFNLGAEGQYAFSRNDNGRFYGLLGTGYYYSNTSDSTKPGNRIANPFRLGLGAGYEWFMTGNLVTAISGAITWFPSTSEVYPLPEIGLFYYFQ